MPIVSDIRKLLLDNATIASLVGNTRIHSQVMPQDGSLPAIVLTLVSYVPENSLDGSAENRLGTSRVQVDCYSPRYEQAHLIQEAVNSVIANLRTPIGGVMDSMRDLYDDETRVFRVSADYLVTR